MLSLCNRYGFRIKSSNEYGEFGRNEISLIPDRNNKPNGCELKLIKLSRWFYVIIRSENIIILHVASLMFVYIYVCSNWARSQQSTRQQNKWPENKARDVYNEVMSTLEIHYPVYNPARQSLFSICFVLASVQVQSSSDLESFVQLAQQLLWLILRGI